MLHDVSKHFVDCSAYFLVELSKSKDFVHIFMVMMHQYYLLVSMSLSSMTHIRWKNCQHVKSQRSSLFITTGRWFSPPIKLTTTI